jgi:hypothetical protein
MAADQPSEGRLLPLRERGSEEPLPAGDTANLSGYFSIYSGMNARTRSIASTSPHTFLSRLGYDSARDRMCSWPGISVGNCWRAI